MRKPAIVGHFYFAATHPSLHFPHFKKLGDRNLQEIWSARVTLHSCQNCSDETSTSTRSLDKKHILQKNPPASPMPSRI